MSLIPALGSKRQEDLCEFKASLIYGVSSRTALGLFTQRNPVLGKKINSLTELHLCDCEYILI